jgi:hypothetical protein
VQVWGGIWSVSALDARAGSIFIRTRKSSQCFGQTKSTTRGNQTSQSRSSSWQMPSKILELQFDEWSLGWPQIEWLSQGHAAEILGRDTVRRIKSSAKTKLQSISKERLGRVGSHDLCTPSILAAFANFFPVPERYTINGMCSCMGIAASTNAFEPGAMVNSRLYF